MSKIPENVIQAGCTAYARKFLHGNGSMGDGIEAAYEVMSIHPDVSPKATWNGEGLPPVGTVCEYDGGTHDPDDPFDKDLSVGAQVTIIAHIADGDIAVFTFNPGNPNRGQIAIDMGRYGCFRLIRTAEQIAAEERLAVIKEMASAAHRPGQISVTKLEMAERLYDAGYRKQVQP